MNNSYGYSLYYPYLHFQDDNWLKTAALYYDGLYRIVPHNFQTNDDSFVNELIEHEFIKNIDPKKSAAIIADEFRTFTKKELTSETNRKKILKSMNAKIPQDSSFEILIDKVDKNLADKICSLGLAQRTSEYSLKFEPATGAIYMTCLANNIAQEQGIHIVSDDPDYQPFIRNFQSSNMNQSYSDDALILASLAIETIIPDKIENIPFERIIKFRKKNQEQRLLFYEKINEMAEGFQNVKNPDAFKDCLKHHNDLIQIEVKKYKNALRDVGIGTTVGTLGISLPSWASEIGEKFPENEIVITSIGLIAAGFVIGTKGALQYYQSKKNSPWAYVLSLEHLRSKSFLERMFPKIIL